MEGFGAPQKETSITLVAKNFKPSNHFHYSTKMLKIPNQSFIHMFQSIPVHTLIKSHILQGKMGSFIGSNGKITFSLFVHVSSTHLRGLFENLSQLIQ